MSLNEKRKEKEKEKEKCLGALPERRPILDYAGAVLAMGPGQSGHKIRRLSLVRSIRSR